MKNIAVCIPWRDRAWVAPDTLAALEAQTYPAEKLGFLFVAHNCEDNTLELLADWCRANQGRYRYCQVMGYYDDTRPDGRTTRERDRSEHDPRHAQAKLKNMMKERLQPDEHWFFCDSDILLHPLCLETLAAADKDIVGGLANVDPQRTLWNFFPRTSFLGQPFRRDLSRPVPTTLERVGLVAGILLYSPRACQNTSFRFIGTGEDEGAIRDAERCGIEIWLEPRAIGEHVMRRQDLESSRERWQSWQA